MTAVRQRFARSAFTRLVWVCLGLGAASSLSAQPVLGPKDVPPAVVQSLRASVRLADSVRQAAPLTIPQDGAADAPLVVEVFGDFQCPACALHQAHGESVLREFVGRGLVRVIYYDVPLPFHANAMDAAMIYHCAAAQGPWQRAVRDRLYAQQRAWQDDPAPLAAFQAVLAPLGVDTVKLAQCYEQGPFLPVLQYGLREAQRRNVSGTPAFIIGGTMATGALAPERLRAVLMERLTGSPAPRVGPAWKQVPPPGH